MRQVLNAEADAKAAVPKDRKAAELEPPSEVVTLKTKDGKELKVNVGGEGGFGNGVAYLTSSDKPAIMAVPRDAVAALFKKLDAFRDPYLLASSPGDYQRVKLTLSKVDKKEAPKGSLVLIKKSEGLWEYKDPEGYDGSADMGDAAQRSADRRGRIAERAVGPQGRTGRQEQRLRGGRRHGLGEV